MHDREEMTMWIRVDVATPDGRKARRLARAIEHGPPLEPVPAHDPRVVLGTLVMLWLKTRVHAPDGVLADYAIGDIADLIGCTDAEVQAMVETQWLDQRPEGFEVHEWMEHNGDHLREAQRKRETRDGKSRASESGPEGPASSLSRPSRPSRPVRHADVRETAADGRRTSSGRPRTTEDAGLTPPEPRNGSTVLPPQAPVDAASGRVAIFTAAGVPKDQWDGIEAYCGLSADDDSPEANAQRLSLAAMDHDELTALLEPVGEANRQRALDLLHTATGGATKSGATLADIKRETAPTVKRVHVGAIAEMSKGLGKTGQATAIRLATWLFNHGVTHDGLLKRFVQHYVDHAAGIREPYAYYNPGRDGFEFIRTRCAADASVDEHEALLAAERRWLTGADADD